MYEADNEEMQTKRSKSDCGRSGCSLTRFRKKNFINNDASRVSKEEVMVLCVTEAVMVEQRQKMSNRIYGENRGLNLLSLHQNHKGYQKKDYNVNLESLLD